MNIKHIIAITTLAFTSSAVFADSPYPIDKPFVSTKTRAEVIAELKEARAQGLLANRNNYPIIHSAPSYKTRAEVVAELEAARAQQATELPQAREAEARLYRGS